MPVIIDSTPNKWLRLSGVLGNYLDQNQQQSQANDLVQQQKNAIFQKVLGAYISGDPTTQANIKQAVASNPDMFEGLNLPDNMQQPPLTPEQTLANTQADAQTKAINAGPSLAPPTYGPSPEGTPSPADRLDAWLKNYRATYKQDPPQDVTRQIATYLLQGTTGQTTANEIANKQTLDAQQQQQANENTRDYSTIKLPESKSKIAKEGAETVKTGAETKKIGAETTGINQTNQLLSDSNNNRDIKTTSTGRQYADVGIYSGKTKNTLVQAYRDRGIPTLDKADADAINQIEVARKNYAAMLKQIESDLPKDAGGRIVAGPGNKLAQIFQTSGTLGAYKTWRSAAIQSMRAMAGSKGLRINQSEILQASQNDIPQITDDYPTAKQRVEDGLTMLKNQEDILLGGQSASEQANPLGLTPPKP